MTGCDLGNRRRCNKPQMTVERGIAGSARRWESMDTIRKPEAIRCFSSRIIDCRRGRAAAFLAAAAGDSLVASTRRVHEKPS